MIAFDFTPHAHLGPHTFATTPVPSGTGTVVNGPTRGVTGRTWTGESDSFVTLPEQYAALRTLCHVNMATFGFGPEKVIGHRETRSLVPAEFATKKECPGRLVDMAAFRASLLEAPAVA